MNCFLKWTVLLGVIFNQIESKRRVSRSELVIRPLSAERCLDLPDLALSWANASLRMVGRTNVVMDIHAKFNRPAKTLHKLAISKVACSEAISANTCSHPQEWSFDSGVCAIISTPLMPWTPILAALKPAFKCPVKAGNYSGHNIRFDTSIVSTFAGQTLQEGVVHLVKGALYDQDSRPFACLKVTVDVIRVRIAADR